MDKMESETADGIRCIKCGHMNTASEAPNGNYLMRCTKCKSLLEFTENLLNYAKQNNGYLPPLSKV
jgi:phage FluMu protein Com